MCIRDRVKAAQVRGKWIDQSQSLNIFYRGTSGQAVSDLYLYAWEAGLKTTYYLRTLSATQVEKSTIDAEGTQLRKKPDSDKTSQPEAKKGQSVKSPINTLSPITTKSLERDKVSTVQKKNGVNLHIAGEEICESCQ